MNLTVQLSEALRAPASPRRADQWPTHKARARNRRARHRRRTGATT